MTLPKYIHIEGKETLVRDTYSMGVLNTNAAALAESQRATKQAILRIGDQRRKDMELNTLRKEVSELKELVLRLLDTKGA